MYEMYAKDAASIFPHTRARVNKVEIDSPDDEPEDEAEWQGSEPRSPLPTFQQDYHWPAPLDKILSFGKTAPQRDVLLLGALTVLGASLSLIVRCLYSRKWKHPCLQIFVVVPAAAGKGVLVWVRKLIEPIHDEIRSHVAEAMKAYRKEKAAYEALGKARKDKEAPEGFSSRIEKKKGRLTRAYIQCTHVCVRKKRGSYIAYIAYILCGAGSPKDYRVNTEFFFLP